MRIAVLSGKGGAGKTLVSVNLAAAAKSATYVDCDVEAPNGHLFFKPTQVSQEEVTVDIPFVYESKCNGCRKCVDFCKFNALAYIKKNVMVFEDVCHSCGGCAICCPTQAIGKTSKTIGLIQKGNHEGIKVHTGVLNIGQASGVPIVERLLGDSDLDNEKTVIVDCPPGSACLVMESIKQADFCILVAEPTLFGAHNVGMVYELVKLFGKKFAVVLNKCIDGPNPSKDFCLENNIDILCCLEFDSQVGQLSSEGQIVAQKLPSYNELFLSILEKAQREVSNVSIAGS